MRAAGVTCSFKDGTDLHTDITHGYTPSVRNPEKEMPSLFSIGKCIWDTKRGLSIPNNLCSQSPLLQNARAVSCRARPCRGAMRLTVVRSQATPLGSDSIL